MSGLPGGRHLHNSATGSQGFRRELAKQSVIPGSETAKLPLPVLKEHVGNGRLFGIRSTQGTLNPVKVSQLEVASRAYSVALFECRSQCSFGDSGRSRQIRYDDRLAGLLLEQLEGPTDDLSSRNLRSSGRVKLARLWLPENFIGELSQSRPSNGRCK
jgi:hypothetical protein